MRRGGVRVTRSVVDPSCVGVWTRLLNPRSVVRAQTDAIRNGEVLTEYGVTKLGIDGGRKRASKVLVLVPVPHAVSGVTRVALTLSAQLQKQGLAVQVVLPLVSGHDPVAVAWAMELGTSFEAAGALLPDDVGRGWRDVWALRQFVTKSGARVVNIHYGGSRPSLKDLIGIRLAGVRCVVACHNHSFRMPLRHALPTRLASFLASAIIPCSGEIADILADAGVSRKKLVTIHGGVPAPPHKVPTRARAREALGLPDNAFVVGTVTRLSPEKAVGRLVSAVARLPALGPDVHLIVKGDDGPEHTRLLEQGNELLGSRFHLLNMSADNEDVYAALDVFALSSDREGYPLVLMEAAYRGLPCVSTAVGSIAELIVDGETGFLVEDGDIEGITGHLERFRADPQLQRLLGLKARRHAEKEFSDEVMARRFAEVLSSA